MSPTVAFLSFALACQVLFILRLIRHPARGPALVWPILALASSIGVLVHAWLRRDMVLLLGQSGLAILYLLHLRQRWRRDDDE